MAQIFIDFRKSRIGWGGFWWFEKSHQIPYFIVIVLLDIHSATSTYFLAGLALARGKESLVTCTGHLGT
jgi:hypothetical protein